MSGTKTIGLVLLLAGMGLGVAALRADSSHRATNRAAAMALANEQTQARLTAERHRLESRVAVFAQVQPLLTALDNNIDGDTLVGLFRSAYWWRDVRMEFPMTRVVVGTHAIATYGAPDPGSSDRDVTIEARKNAFSSGVVKIGGKSYFLLASRLAALPDQVPVLVLAKAVAPDLIGEVAIAAPAPQTLSDVALLGGAVCLFFIGGVLLIFSRSRSGARGAATPGKTLRANTLPFGSTADNQAAIYIGAGGARFGPSKGPTGGRAPAPVAVPSRPAPAGPPRRRTVPGGLPVAEDGTPGQTFGRYHLLDRLGQGGMADVFAAVAHGVEGFTRVFALKRLRPEFAHDKEMVAQFIDEARMQSSLVHSNIVPVFDFGRVGKEYFMTQEYIVGRDVARLMVRCYEQTQQTLTPCLAYYIAHETLLALQYAHTKCDREGNPLGIIHRDISAGNIILSAQGEVKLADFGIAISNRRLSETQMKMVKGNANFMSPEQARGQQIDARSDLFSVALVLYYCLTNKLFYEGDNDLEVVFRAASGPTPEDYELVRRLPSPASDVLGRALSRDPADRFQSAAEFADALASHIDGSKADAVRLMQTLFGDELRKEAA